MEIVSKHYMEMYFKQCLQIILCGGGVLFLLCSLFNLLLCNISNGSILMKLSDVFKAHTHYRRGAMKTCRCVV